MHDGAAPGWREVMEKHYSALVDELGTRIDSDWQRAMNEAVAAERLAVEAQTRRACDDARRTQAEALNQALRGIRTGPADHVLKLLGEECARFAERLVVLVFESNQGGENQARAAAGVEVENFDVETAPAMMAAIESRDPVVAIATAAQVSPALASALEAAGDGKAYLFPVVARQSVMAMLAASGVEVSAPIELLCGAAGMGLESAAQETERAEKTEPHKTQPVVQLSAGVPASATAAARSWDELTAEDQALHLQAQRMARLRVAEMRLDHTSELQHGGSAEDIY